MLSDAQAGAISVVDPVAAHQVGVSAGPAGNGGEQPLLQDSAGSDLGVAQRIGQLSDAHGHPTRADPRPNQAGVGVEKVPDPMVHGPEPAPGGVDRVEALGDRAAHDSQRQVHVDIVNRHHTGRDRLTPASGSGSIAE